MDKALLRSVTVVSGAVVALTTYLESVGVLPPGAITTVQAAEGHVVGLAGHLVDLVQVAGGLGVVFGLRRAQGVAIDAAKRAAPLLLAALLLAGCASYDRIGLVAAASAYESAPVAPLAAEECDALRLAALHLESGPDRALLVVGKGSTLRDLSALFGAHAHQCDRALTLQADGADVSRTVAAFRRSWAVLGEVSQ